MSDPRETSGSATPAKPVKKRTSSTRRKSGGTAKSKPAAAASGGPEHKAAAEQVPAQEPAAVVEPAAPVPDAQAGEAPQEGAASGVPTPTDEPKLAPLVTQWLSRPLSPTAEQRLERMRRTVPGYKRPSRAAMMALRVSGWALFIVLGIAVGATLVGALDRTMEATLVGGEPAGQTAQLIAAQEGQKVRVVNNAGVNLRSQPRQGVTFVMVRLKKGTILTLIASKPDEPTPWFKVRAPTGENGWVVDDKIYTQLVEAPK